MTIFEENPSPHLTLVEQAGDPSTPAAGKWRLFTKAGGLYIIDDAGTVTGPFAISAEAAFVGCRYTTNAGQSISSSTGFTIIDFEDIDYDADTLVTTGASWKFTAPATGKYHIDVMVSFVASSAWAAVSERGSLALYKNNAELYWC